MTDKRPMTAGQMRAAGGVPEVHISPHSIVSTPIAPEPREIRLPFDPEKESIFCARCGRKCEPLGHLMAMFLLCPTHGEFTIAPVVMQNADKFDLNTGEVVKGDRSWSIKFDSEQDRMEWQTCREIDARGLSGRQTRTGP